MEGEQTWPTEEELQEAAGVVLCRVRVWMCVCTHVGVRVECLSERMYTHLDIIKYVHVYMYNTT